MSSTMGRVSTLRRSGSSRVRVGRRDRRCPRARGSCRESVIRNRRMAPLRECCAVRWPQCLTGVASNPHLRPSTPTPSLDTRSRARSAGTTSTRCARTSSRCAEDVRAIEPAHLMDDRRAGGRRAARATAHVELDENRLTELLGGGDRARVGDRPGGRGIDAHPGPGRSRPRGGGSERASGSEVAPRR